MATYWQKPKQLQGKNNLLSNNFKHFESWLSFNNFQRDIKQNARYIHSEKANQFLETVLETARDRITTIPKDVIYWRAQLGSILPKGDDEFEYPFSQKRMKPTAEFAADGRVNPKGIPCLYMSKERDTALAEVRPWIGAKISVSKCNVNKKLRIVNCYSDTKLKVCLIGEPPPEERKEMVWAFIDHAFSEPVSREDNTLDYIPTQVIAELFKKNGYDGIAYGSSLGEGYNLALFDIDNAYISNVQLHELKQICFKFKKIEGPY